MTRKSIYGEPMQHRSHKKISDEQVLEIRKAPASDRELAKVYGVSKSTICAIRNRKMRKRVPDVQN